MFPFQLFLILHISLIVFPVFSMSIPCIHFLLLFDFIIFLFIFFPPRPMASSTGFRLYPNSAAYIHPTSEPLHILYGSEDRFLPSASVFLSELSLSHVRLNFSIHQSFLFPASVNTLSGIWPPKIQGFAIFVSIMEKLSVRSRLIRKAFAWIKILALSSQP